MAEKKIGRVIYRQTLSPRLEIFRVAPEDSVPFPLYKSGQYIALSRDNCKLTKKVVGLEGEINYVRDVDESGNQKRGMVTHSYSISSAPFETEQKGYLEFYIALEMMGEEIPGRLSESLFDVDPDSDSKITYINKIAGEFTLEKRASGFQNVVMVGTGTGLAPFAAMMKQLHFEAVQGQKNGARFTLFHANRTFKELGYHEELQTIEESKLLDFVYVPTVSRPIPKDLQDARIGEGRANNLLRYLFGIPLKEQQDLIEAKNRGEDTSHLERIVPRVVKPLLPRHVSHEKLLERMDPKSTVILTCGNPKVMKDIKHIADTVGIRIEKEEW